MHPSQAGVVTPFLKFKEAQLFWLIFLFQEMMMFNLAKSDVLVTSGILVSSLLPYILNKNLFGIYRERFFYIIMSGI